VDAIIGQKQEAQRKGDEVKKNIQDRHAALMKEAGRGTRPWTRWRERAVLSAQIWT
jgi:hypothetical protein